MEARTGWIRKGRPPERRPRPGGLEGFGDSARDIIKPMEMAVSGGAALSQYIHRFSAANGHVLAAFGMTPAYFRVERRGFSTFEFRRAREPLAAGRRRGSAPGSAAWATPRCG